MEDEKSAELFDVRTQLLSQGRSDTLLAKTDAMTIRIKCYAQGGENALHTHLGEDHSFVVLDGAARFFGKDGEIGVVSKNQGILLPKGVYYYFESCGDTPLVLLRMGAKTGSPAAGRVDLEGKPLPGHSSANKHEEGVPIEGRYYG